jgi:glutamate N-acetyltransferase/amino-acid N-acetyltransferase
MPKTIPVSPLAPRELAELPALGGVDFAVAEAGIRYRGRTDLLVMRFGPDTEVAGVLTTSRCASAPVEWCRAMLPAGRARALVVNSGNANAFTGMRGREATRRTAEAAARAVGCAPEEVFLASTGVIGEPLDPERFEAVMDGTVARAAPEPWLDAARAIMTTDTFPKLATAAARLGAAEVTINGIAKGSGMIAPDMATMLAFVVTDAPLSRDVLQALLSRGVETSFNAVTVDSDTSTSDTLLLFATGAAEERGAPRIEDAADPRLEDFGRALQGLLDDLAIQVARDGEGATKLVTVMVEEAVSDVSAKRVAMAIANSPLVKTAIAGEDANWGRVVMAVGKAGEPADRDRLSIFFGDLRVAKEGMRDPDYSEAAASAYMKNDQIDIRVVLGLGSGRFTAFTCDLTHGYISINGDYRS